MGVADVIKDSVLQGFNTGSLSTVSILTTLGMSALMGLYIYIIYRLTSRSGFYNRTFNKTLAILPMITAIIMMGMSSNLIISFGMVGALSIVRFRNAVKDPADLMHLFWSISMGIVVGAGLYELAIFGSLGITVLAFGLDLLPALRLPCMLVISGSGAEAEAEIMACIRKYVRKFRVRSRNVSRKGAEWIVELQVKEEGRLLQDLSSIHGVDSVHIMTHDGEVRF